MAQKKIVKATGKTLLGYLLFAVYMVPFVLVLINSFKKKINIVKQPLMLLDEDGLQWQNYLNAIDEMDFFRSFGNSLVITVCSVLILTVCTSMAAYIFVRADWRICKASFTVMLLSMVVPFQTIMIPLVYIYGSKFELLNSKLTLILMNFGLGAGMCMFMFHGFVKTNIPASLEEAAAIDGAGPVSTFFRIVFPLMKPIISTVVILETLNIWNDYLLPSLVLGKKELYTLPLAIRIFYGTYSNDYGKIMAGLILSIIPVIALYCFLQKYVIGGVVAGAVKS